MMKPTSVIGAGAAAIALLAAHAPALAQQRAGHANAPAEARAAATEAALLEALLKRRAEILAAPGAAEDKRDALAFLDSRIAELRSRVAD